MAGITGWRAIPLAGGYVTGQSMSDDFSTWCVRTDVGNAYVWNAAAQRWEMLFTRASLPADVWDASVSPGGNAFSDDNGCYEIAVAPSDGNIIYGWFNGYFLKTTNRGVTWAKTGLNGGGQVKAKPNAGHARYCGPKAAVDPINPDVVYIGTSDDGLHRTLDGGATWTKRTDVPDSAYVSSGPEDPADNRNIVLVAVDRSSSTTSGRKSRVIAFSLENGAYESTDGGGAFALIAGSPTDVAWMRINGAGVTYLTEQVTSTTSLKRILVDGTVEGVTTGSAKWHSLAISRDDQRIVVINTDGALAHSNDGGDTFTETYFSGYPAPNGWTVTAPATDVPWIGFDTLLNPGSADFNPTNDNELLVTTGVGVLRAIMPDGFTRIDYTSAARGIEMIVARDICSPPGGNPLLIGMDRPAFLARNPDSSPFRYGPRMTSEGVALHHGWAADYVGTFIACLATKPGLQASGYSLDGGKTWSLFATQPSIGSGGSIAASTTQKIMVSPGNDYVPVWTRDRGATWEELVLPSPGIPPSGRLGFQWGEVQNIRHIVTAVKDVDGRFLIYNYGPAEGNEAYNAIKGIWRVDIPDEGEATVTHLYTSAFPSSTFHAKLKAVPGHVNDVLFTAGDVGGDNPADVDFMRSTDQGATWSAIANVKEVKCFGFGQWGGAYPAILFVGYVSGTFGMWKTEDNFATAPTLIDDFPDVDIVNCIAGVSGKPGHIIVGLAGSGFRYYGARACARHLPVAA